MDKNPPTSSMHSFNSFDSFSVSKPMFPIAFNASNVCKSKEELGKANHFAASFEFPLIDQSIKNFCSSLKFLNEQDTREPN